MPFPQQREWRTVSKTNYGEPGGGDVRILRIPRYLLVGTSVRQKCLVFTCTALGASSPQANIVTSETVFRSLYERIPLFPWHF